MTEEKMIMAYLMNSSTNLRSAFARVVVSVSHKQKNQEKESTE